MKTEKYCEKIKTGNLRNDRSIRKVGIEILMTVQYVLNLNIFL